MDECTVRSDPGGCEISAPTPAGEVEVQSREGEKQSEGVRPQDEPSRPSPSKTTSRRTAWLPQQDPLWWRETAG